MFSLNFKLIVLPVLIQILYNWNAIKCNHVSAVRCAERIDCLEHINEEIIATILSNIHNESDPCVNFWDYACGDWTSAPYYDHVDTFGAIGNYYAEQMQKYLVAATHAGTNQQETNETELNQLFEKLRTYYKTCRNIKTYYLEMGKYFEELPIIIPAVPWPNMSEVLRGKEDIVKWQAAESFNWLKAIAELRCFGVNGIFLDESVGWAFNDSEKYVIELKMPDEDDKFHSKFELIELFIAFGWIEGSNSEEKHLKFAARIYELVLQLRELRYKHRVGNRLEGDGEEALTLHDLKLKASNIDWQSYFDILFGQTTYPELLVEVEGIAYMREVGELLQQTDADVIAFYILMRVGKFLIDVSPQITDKNCIDHMGVYFPLGMNYIYDRFVYKTIRVHDEKVLQTIFAKLKLQFAKYLQSTRNKLNLKLAEIQYLLDKLDKMRLRLGNLPQQMPARFYNHYYDTANVTQVNFFRNHWEMLRFRTHQQHAPLLSATTTTTASRTLLPTCTSTTTTGYITHDDFYINDDISQIRNAPYFVHQRNLLIVPMIFVQMPFFHHKLHAVFQYSLVGWILAHELNHAFETDGITLDADGNESVIGAGIKAKPEFKIAVHCLKRTPTASLIERIADVNGFQLAYDAYFDANVTVDDLMSQYMRNSLFASNELFSMRKLYFLNFAQFFCGTLPRPIDHDRDDVRVIEILANMPEFAEVFRCVGGGGGAVVKENEKRKNQLHAVEKCQMWRD